MNVRELALRFLGEYETEGKYVNLLLSSPLVSSLSQKEKSQLTALLYTSVENKLKYDYYIAALSGRSIDKIDLQTKNLLRLGMCQILDMSGVPDFAAVAETVKLARHSGERAFVNGILRTVARAKEEGNLPSPNPSKDVARYLSIAYSFPKATVKHFISLYGDENTEKLLSSFNTKRSTDITVNALKMSREKYLSLLHEAGITASLSSFSSLSVRIYDPIAPRDLPGFSDGLFFVQDEACAVSSEILGIESGECVVDVCSAPGGKSFAAAILSGDLGTVRSFDIHESKMSLIESGAERLGLKSVRLGVRDAREPEPSLIGKIDRVICDVPCSGLGVLGKKPDLRYKNDVSSDLSSVQYSILRASFSYLRRGGTLVYSTCTLNPEENENVVRTFLSEESAADFVDFSVGEYKSECGMMTLLPFVHGTDGFFIAKLIKK